MKRILVIEDEPDIQEMLCAYLRDAGYSVSAASDGIQAMDCFHRESGSGALRHHDSGHQRPAGAQAAAREERCAGHHGDGSGYRGKPDPRI